MSKIKDWATEDFTLTLNGSQANTILKALLNESASEGMTRGEYTAAYYDFATALSKAGYWTIKKESK